MKDFYLYAICSLVLSFVFHILEIKPISKILFFVACVLAIIKYFYDKHKNNDNDSDNDNDSEPPHKLSITKKWWYNNH